MDAAFSPRKKICSYRRHRAPFTPEEDELLKNLVYQHGKNWKYIASQMNKRNERQVRDRWQIWLDPSVNRGPFTEEEDKLLTELYKKHGPKWTILTHWFNRRTDVILKSRWRSLNRFSDRGRKMQQPIKQIQTEEPQQHDFDFEADDFSYFWTYEETVDPAGYFPLF